MIDSPPLPGRPRGHGLVASRLLALCAPVILALSSLILSPIVRASDEQPPVPFPDLATTVGLLLKRDYYDPSRFKPEIMVQRALRALDAADVSILTTWKDGTLVLDVGGRSQTLPAPVPTSIDQAMAILQQVGAALSKGGFSPVQRRNLIYVMINGALSTLDPHTLLMPPDPASEFAEDIAGEFFGIGAFLNQEDGVISIEHVMAGLPAERAGIEDGDIILRIDGETTAGLSLDQAVHRIKGPKGTLVHLTVERKGLPAPKDIAIIRDLVQEVTLRQYRTGDIGYVRMDGFSANTARDLYEAISSLLATGPLKGFVLDLRFNGGGLLDQARTISDFFLPRKREIVRTVTVNGPPEIYTSSGRMILDAPMIVITSGGSASAAEILSGCLQRNDRAVIAGETTFGKGSVQTIRALRDGSRLKLTIQEYQLSGGVSIQDVGITPDLTLVRHPVLDDGAVDIVPFSFVREQDDEFALSAHNNYHHDSGLELGWVADHQGKAAQRASSIAAVDFHPDPEAAMVIDLLKQALSGPGAAPALAAAVTAGTWRQTLLGLLKAPVQARAKVEAARLATIFAATKPPIIWGPDGAPAPGSLTLSYLEPAKVTAGTRAALHFKVENKGAVTLGRLYGIVRVEPAAPRGEPDKSSPLLEDEVIFGAVPAHGATVGTLAFAVPARLYGGEERFHLDLYRDGSHDLLASTPVSLQITAIPRPHFSYRWKLVTPTGDGTLRTGEADTLRLTLVNDGPGASLPVYLYVFKDDDAFIQLGAGRFKLQGLAPGASTTVAVPLTIMATGRKAGHEVPFAEQEITLQIRAEEHVADGVDGRYRAVLFHALKLPVGHALSGGEIIQPTLTLVGTDELPDHQVRLHVHVVPEPIDLAVFLNDDKIAMIEGAKMPGGDVALIIPLATGLNNVSLVATGAGKVMSELPLRLWGPDAKSPPVVTPPAVVITNGGTTAIP